MPPLAMPSLPSTSTNRGPGEPPPYSERDPNNDGYHDVGYANRMLGVISAFPGSDKKRIIERMIKIHNANTVHQGDRVLLSDKQGFGQQYPKLNRLIGQLDFINLPQVGCFAFACGLYSLYCDVRNETDIAAQSKKVFFERYFLTEGSDQGVAKLQLFTACDILVGNPAQKFNSVMDGNIDVEYLAGLQDRLPTPEFDFQTVFTVVASKIGNHSLGLASRLGLIDDMDQLFGRGDPDSRSKIMILLNEFAQRGGRDTELPAKLDSLGRRDLCEALEKIQNQRCKRAPVQCSDQQPPAKSKR